MAPQGYETALDSAAMEEVPPAMKNVLHVLGRDLLRLLKAPAALVVVVVLVVLPSTYTWFNVIGFWNPYDNTGNMRVCVVNQDAGSENDLMGQMNLGNQIVDTLHENNQLKWEFTDYDDAMRKVNRARCMRRSSSPRTSPPTCSPL